MPVSSEGGEPEEELEEAIAGDSFPQGLRRGGGHSWCTIPFTFFCIGANFFNHVLLPLANRPFSNVSFNEASNLQHCFQRHFGILRLEQTDWCGQLRERDSGFGKRSVSFCTDMLAPSVKRFNPAELTVYEKPLK